MQSSTRAAILAWGLVLIKTYITRKIQANQIVGSDGVSHLHVIMLSGKRMSGKDTFAQYLIDALKGMGLRAQQFALADVTKLEYAASAGIDAKRLLADREFKELHRASMTSWFHQRLATDPSFCCKKVIHHISSAPGLAVAIISDLRLMEDLKFFLDPSLGFKRVITMRLNVHDSCRALRGWKQSAIDSDITETSFDEYNAWDFCIDNDGNLEALRSRAIDIGSELV
jgi:phosphomevalonate kinase